MNLIRSSITIGLFTGLSILFNFGSNVVIANAFGASHYMDAYLAAIAVPIYFVTVTTGMLGIAFVPIFADYKNSDAKMAWETVNAVVNLAIVASTALVILGGIFSVQILHVFAPGFSVIEQTYAATIFRYYLPVVAITVVNELLASVYYSHGEYIAPLVNKVIAPSVSISMVLMFGARMNVMSLVLSAVLGSMLQCLILVYGIARNPKFSYRISWVFINEGSLKILKLMIPLGAGTIIYKIVPVFDRMIVSEMPVGSISCLNYAARIQSMIVQLLSSSVSLAVFPLMAQLVAAGDSMGLKENMSKIIRVLFFLSAPIATLMIVFGETIISFVFQRGAFTPEITHVVYKCLAVYMISLPIVTIGGIVSQGFYVLKDTVTTSIVGVVEVILYITLCLALINKLGIFVVPVVYDVYFVVSVLTLALLFRYKLRLGGGRHLVTSCSTHILISIFLGLMGYWFRVTVIPSIMVTLFACVVIIISYISIALWMKVEEAEYIWERLHAIVYRG